MKPNPNFYAQKVSQIVQEIEKIGEKMNPDYEFLRQMIDKKQLDELTDEKKQEIRTAFQVGTDQYKALFDQLKKLRAPARVMGMHKKFERAFEDYVAGCQGMVDSLKDTTVDVSSFAAAEKQQDDATDAISFAIQRIMNLLTGR